MAIDRFDNELMNRMCVVCHRTSMVFGSNTVLCLLLAILPLDTEMTVTYPVSCSAAQLSAAKPGHKEFELGRD